MNHSDKALLFAVLKTVVLVPNAYGTLEHAVSTPSPNVIAVDRKAVFATPNDRATSNFKFHNEFAYGGNVNSKRDRMDDGMLKTRHPSGVQP